MISMDQSWQIGGVVTTTDRHKDADVARAGEDPRTLGFQQTHD